MKVSLVAARFLTLASAPLALDAASLNGAVKDPTGYPVAQAVVWAVTADCLEPHRAVSDKQGHYSFENLPAGDYKIFATHPGFRQIGEKSTRVGNDGSGNADLQLVVSGADTGGSPPSIPLAGILTDANGLPIRGARVTVSGRERPNEISSDPEGRFGFCRVTGVRVKLRIESQEFKPRTIIVDLASRKTMGELRIALRKR